MSDNNTIDFYKEVDNLAILLGKECCINEKNPKPCINCYYNARKVITLGYTRTDKSEKLAELLKQFISQCEETGQHDDLYHDAKQALEEYRKEIQNGQYNEKTR